MRSSYEGFASIHINDYEVYLGDVSHVTVLHHVIGDGPTTNVYDKLQEQETPVQLLEEDVVEAE